MGRSRSKRRGTKPHETPAEPIRTAKATLGSFFRETGLSPAQVARLARSLLAACRRAGAPARPSESLLEWGQRYLASHFRQEPSSMHRWLAERLDRACGKRGLRLNVLAPRGNAKSTVVTLAFVLREVLEEREPYVWIVSSTQSQAKAHLANVMNELTDNARLAEDYPLAVGKGASWRSESLRLRNGVAIDAFGTGQTVRGRRYRAWRPSLIVCDDIQSDRQVASADSRLGLVSWFESALMKAGDTGTNVVNLATALHRDALAMRLAENPGWESKTFRAIEAWPEAMDHWDAWERIYLDLDQDDRAIAARSYYDQHREAMEAGARVLWPERESLYDLMRMRAEEGRAAFEREKQNSPFDPEMCEWPEAYFAGDLWFDEWPREIRLRAIALDPSKGADARHGDYSAFAVVGMDGTGRFFVEADLARRASPQIVSDGVKLVRRFRPDVFGMEANQWEELLGEDFLDAFRHESMYTIEPVLIQNRVNKLVRIRRLGPYLAAGRMLFKRRSPSTRLLVSQLRDFPIGDHDDGPDALEMALRLLADLIGDIGDDGLGDRLIGGP